MTPYAPRAEDPPRSMSKLKIGEMEMKITRRRAMTGMTGFLGVLVVSVGYTAITWAGPPQGVTATLIGRKLSSGLMRFRTYGLRTAMFVPIAASG